MNSANPRSHYLHETPSTIAQSETEDEVSPFFVDLTLLNESNLDHLRSVGLLPPLPIQPVSFIEDLNEDGLLLSSEIASTMEGAAGDASDTANCEEFDPYAIRLLREAHTSYLLNALSTPLSKGFVSLDASHPWMIYWCLHSLDLLSYFDHSTSSRSDNDVLVDVDVMQKGDLLMRIVSTLDSCWTEVTIDLLTEDVMGDARLNLLYQQRQKQSNNQDSNCKSQDKTYTTITAGGFGGGPSQMPHCAPSYAAVLSLSIIASLGTSLQDDESNITTKNTESSHHPYHKAGLAALHSLSSKRLQLYAFFVSLRVSAFELYGVTNSTAFRMQHDGEVDVRASYCLLAPCYLLGLLNDENDDDNHHLDTRECQTKNSNLLTVSAISRHIASCQTFEGGFGAEPQNEAHGGYTFCALAALRILNSVDTIDVNALQGWLARRQLGYEGGFCGRTNKLVDGCYSFWQGGAVTLLDGWLLEQRAKNSDCDKQAVDNDLNMVTFDEVLLQRYILLCAQDVNGGLRDKPSKQRDFYHSCYNLSGLSVAQHNLPLRMPKKEGNGSAIDDHGLNDMFGDKNFNVVGRTDPVINIRVERVQFMIRQRLNQVT